MTYQVRICFKSFDNLSIETSITKILQINNYLKNLVERDTRDRRDTKETRNTRVTRDTKDTRNTRDTRDTSSPLFPLTHLREEQNNADQLRKLYPKGYKGYRVSLPCLKKKFTVLRSPHVDKKSREQFEWTRYKKSIFLDFHKIKALSLFLFLLKNGSFPGVQLEINLKHSTFYNAF